MPRSTINFDTVRKVGLALPGVEESTAYGAPALKIRGKLLACMPTHRSAEPNSLAVRVGFDDRVVSGKSICIDLQGITDRTAVP
jgi:hypothetical protein